MAVKEVEQTSNGTTGNGAERKRKASEPIKIGATHDATGGLLQVGASVPGNVYDALVTLAAARDGAVDGDNLVRRFLNEEVQRALFSYTGTDYDTWYTEYQSHRKATRQSAGGKGGATKAQTGFLASLIGDGDDDDDSKLMLVLSMKRDLRAAHPDWTKEQIAKEINDKVFAS